MTTQIYLITPPRISSLSEFAESLKPILDTGEIACLQLRLKDVTDSEILKAIDFLCPIVQSRDVAFILNDRPDLAASTPCDGVHIGQDDMSYEKARQLMGPDRIIGVTCHNSRHLAMEAGEKGADYVAFGAFFSTDTKEVKYRADPEILSWWHELFTVPSVAIGGITPENCRVLIEKGTDFLAISSGIWNHPKSPSYALKQIKQIITEIYF